MPASDAGKISQVLLDRYGISRIGFEYIENFLFSIKYIKANRNFYFQSFEEFVSSRGTVRLVGNNNFSSPFDSFWYNKVLEAEAVIETAREELRKFYEFWYCKEVDNIKEILRYSSKKAYRKRDLNRIELCRLVENATRLVPLEIFYSRDSELYRLG